MQQAVCYNCFRYVADSGPCPYCGYDAKRDEGKYRIALRPGTPLANRYVIGRVLGQGGFGVTYIALDSQTRARVAIKEYLPTELVSRDFGAVNLEAISEDRQADFDYGKQQFLAEARTLAEFVGSENIVNIHSYFEENGTAYFAMEFMEGVNLKQYMEQRGGPLPVHEANKILLPIMEALDWVHSKGIVHRDISPDNIMIRSDGKAKLIDFGAARQSTGEKSKSLDVVLKHGFAPHEQYSRRGRQGPFTDVYAMAATYYYAITGKVPPDAVDRIVEDTLETPSTLGTKIRKNTESVLLKALAVAPKDRWQKMSEFYSAMLETMPLPFSPEAEMEKEQKGISKLTDLKKQTAIIAAVLVFASLLGIGLGTGVLKKRAAVPEPTTSAAPTEVVEVTPEVQEPFETPEPEHDPERKEEFLISGDYLSIGSVITFGAYEQDNNIENGKEPIEWIVLDVQDGRSLLISKYALDAKPYNSEHKNVTWEKCTLRTWLNDTFMNEAFSTEAQQIIPTVTVRAEKNPKYQCDQGKDVLNKIFLLNIQELERYFPSDADRKCTSTAYAEAQGCYANEHWGEPWWWLRTPGGHQHRAAGVELDSGILFYGGADVDFDIGGAVRPALWVDPSRLDYTTVGNTVIFGTYEQDNNPDNGKEAIEWIVLATQDGRSLLVSKYALDCQQYNFKYRSVTWETCSLRKWLNNDFLNEAFSNDEIAQIAMVSINADPNPDYDTDPGKNTEDQVFLLSIPEVEKYFGSDASRKCKPTEFAVAQGGTVNSDSECVWWWLRTPGYYSNSAAYVNYLGSVSSNGNTVYFSSYAVRPALWIDL